MPGAVVDVEPKAVNEHASGGSGSLRQLVGPGTLLARAGGKDFDLVAGLVKACGNPPQRRFRSAGKVGPMTK